MTGPAKRSTGRGFTLIELMIVVVIIGILSAVLVPNLARRFAADKDLAPTEASGPPASAGQAALPAGEPELPGRPPRLESLDAEIDLDTGHRLDGLRVQTLYEAHFRGTFEWRAAQAGPVRLAFPFPAGVLGASEVSLELEDNSSFREPPGVIYALQGLYWSGVPPAETFRTRVTYRASGSERFSYRLPGDGRTPRVRVELRLRGEDTYRVPGTSLPPTTEQDRTLVWEFANLVTQHRDLSVELPAVMHPVGRVMLLAKLAGVAVFLFGAGFWYMAETRQPGHLNRFRWGHFLLLALTYFLFFVIFAVLMFRYHTPTPLGIAVAGALSLPLLVLHVSSNLGGRIALRFALTHVLPLAAFTLGLVINGVYGGEYREYFYIAATVAAVAYFTLTYRSWAAGRLAYREERLRQTERETRQQAREKSLARLRREETACATLEKSQARDVLAAGDDRGCQIARHRVETALARLAGERARLPERVSGSGEEPADIRELENRREILEGRGQELQNALKELEKQRRHQAEQSQQARRQREAALQAAWREWAAQSEAAEPLDRTAEAAGEPLSGVRAALAEALAGEPLAEDLEALRDIADDQAHRQAAREWKRRIERQSSRVQQLAGALRAALARQPVGDRRHCLACGAPVAPGRFCGHCGLPQPESRHCRHCGQVYELPRHLIPAWPPRGPLHCPACGRPYEAGAENAAKTPASARPEAPSEAASAPAPATPAPGIPDSPDPAAREPSP